MKRMAMIALVGAVALTGCSSPRTVPEMGCDTANAFLPELDSVASGSSADDDLHERITEQLELGYYDTETGKLLRLLAEPVADLAGDGYTPVDVDYADMRKRLIDHCELTVKRDMSNA